MRPTSTTSPGSIAASSASGSQVAACSSAIATPPAANNGPRMAIRRHSVGTRSRHESAATATTREAITSIGARGGATVPTAIPAASRMAHKSSLTGGLRSRSGPGRDAPLNRGKGADLLQRLGPYPGYLLELLNRLKPSVRLPVFDDALGGRGPDLWQLVK